MNILEHFLKAFKFSPRFTLVFFSRVKINKPILCKNCRSLSYKISPDGKHNGSSSCFFSLFCVSDDYTSSLCNLFPLEMDQNNITVNFFKRLIFRTRFSDSRKVSVFQLPLYPKNVLQRKIVFFYTNKQEICRNKFKVKNSSLWVYSTGPENL